MDMLCKNCQEPYDWYFLRNEILVAGGMDMYEPARKEGFHNLHFHFTPGPVLQSCPARQSQTGQKRATFRNI